MIKLYGQDPNAAAGHRYSPPVCTGTETNIITGNPDRAHVSTSYIERQNLNVRMGNRHFTRLTNAFPKKVENLVHSVGLYFL